MLNLYDRSAETQSQPSTAARPYSGASYGRELAIPTTANKILFMIEDMRVSLRGSAKAICQTADTRIQ
jgi:hypothetical protein